MPLTSLPVGSRRLVADSLPAFISRHRVGGETAAVWIAESERWFGVLAEIEGSSFPELEGLFEASRSRFEFLAIVGGPTPAVHQVLHVMRISFPTADSPCFFLEDLLRSGQTDWDEVEQDLAARGLCAQSFVSVESSIRVQPLSIAGSAALASYAAVTERLDQLGLQGAMAHQNAATRRSFRRFGVPTESLLSHRRLLTPDGHGGFDERYEPVVIPITPAFRAALRPLGDPPVTLILGGPGSGEAKE